MFNSTCHSFNVVRHTLAAGVTLVAGLVGIRSSIWRGNAFG